MIHTPLGYESRTILNDGNSNERPEGHVSVFTTTI